MASNIQLPFQRLRPRLTPEQGIRWAEALLVAALALALADLTWDIVPASEGRGGVGAAAPTAVGGPGTASTAKERNARLAPSVKILFGTPATKNDGKQEAKPVRETQLDLTLKGVLAQQDSDRKLALIGQEGREEKVYRLGDTVQGAKIVRIESRQVILRRNGVTEALKLEGKELKGESSRLGSRPARAGDGIQRTGKHKRLVGKETLNRQLNNLPKLLRQAKAVPHTRNGKKAGFRVVNIQKGSVFEDLGIREGDVIQSVNGTPIRTPRQALTAYRALKSSDSFRVDVLREGQPVTLSFSVQ